MECTRSWRLWFPTLAAMALLAGGSAAQQFAPRQYSFEDTAPGRAPAQFQQAVDASEWQVVADEQATDGRQVVAVRGRDRGFHVLLAVDPAPADLTLSVRLRADAGAEDQGGGLVFRARDSRNYYVTRWNPLEENVRLYAVAAGERTMFASGRAPTPSA